MNIYFDFELMQQKGDLPYFEISDQLEDALFEMMDFVRARLIVLDEEIKKHPNGVTVLHIVVEKDRPIIHYQYPDELTDKLDSCINQQDFEYLLQKVWAILKPNQTPPTN